MVARRRIMLLPLIVVVSILIEHPDAAVRACATKTDDASAAEQHLPSTATTDHEPCPPEWSSTCPSLPCKPLKTPAATHEVMGWRARWNTPYPDVGSGCFTNCAKQSWQHYINDSAVSAVIIGTGENATAIGCAAHALGKRAFIVHGMSFRKFNTSQLHNLSYTRGWVAHGVKNTKIVYPWTDGVNL
eukprot:COSAG06_NODE_1846_length_8227_cov_10.941683_8_plen_187_part_00